VTRVLVFHVTSRFSGLMVPLFERAEAGRERGMEHKLRAAR
jgi:hypothetical protein